VADLARLLVVSDVYIYVGVVDKNRAYGPCFFLVSDWMCRRMMPGSQAMGQLSTQQPWAYWLMGIEECLVSRFVVSFVSAMISSHGRNKALSLRG
jgi:hypothetical protein